MRYHFKLVKMTAIGTNTKTENVSVGEGVEKCNPCVLLMEK